MNPRFKFLPFTLSILAVSITSGCGKDNRVVSPATQTGGGFLRRSEADTKKALLSSVNATAAWIIQSIRVPAEFDLTRVEQSSLLAGFPVSESKVVCVGENETQSGIQSIQAYDTTAQYWVSLDFLYSVKTSQSLIDPVALNLFPKVQFKWGPATTPNNQKLGSRWSTVLGALVSPQNPLGSGFQYIHYATDPHTGEKLVISIEAVPALISRGRVIEPLVICRSAAQ